MLEVTAAQNSDLKSSKPGRRKHNVFQKLSYKYEKSYKIEHSICYLIEYDSYNFQQIHIKLSENITISRFIQINLNSFLGS